MVGFIEIERGAYDRALASFEAGRRLTDDVEGLNALAGSAAAEARSGRGPKREPSRAYSSPRSAPTHPCLCIRSSSSHRYTPRLAMSTTP